MQKWPKSIKSVFEECIIIIIIIAGPLNRKYLLIKYIYILCIPGKPT